MCRIYALKMYPIKSIMFRAMFLSRIKFGIRCVKLVTFLLPVNVSTKHWISKAAVSGV